METQIINDHLLNQTATLVKASDEKPFILANTEPATMRDLQDKHIIPVFVKDNESLISHCDFVDSVWEVASHVYGEGNIASPKIRVSHPIKGRIPEARNKCVAELTEDEKTIYFERMMFVMDIPCNTEIIDGNLLNLCIGGVKAYNRDNVYAKKGSPEHFIVFIGFKNLCCTNLSVTTDGLKLDIKVTSLLELKNQIYDLLCRFNGLEQLKQLQRLTEYSVNENELAHLIGKCKMYNYLTAEEKKQVGPFLFNDSQVNLVCRDYYQDEHFCRDRNGNISLWKLHNLFTGANKNSYIDAFPSKAENATGFLLHLAKCIEANSPCWFLK